MSTPIPPMPSSQYGAAYEGSPPPSYPSPSGLAIGALVTGIAGLVLTPTLALFLIGGPIGLVMGPTAMVLGWVARGRTKRGEAADVGFALTGLILGAVTLLVAIGVCLLVYPLLGDWD